MLHHIIDTWKLQTEHGQLLDISQYSPSDSSAAGADRFLRMPPSMPCEFVASPDRMVRCLSLLLSDLAPMAKSAAGTISARDNSAVPAPASGVATAATSSSPASTSRLAVLGMDVEWRPIFDQESTGKQQPQASILQLATRDRVVVLDLRELLLLQTFKEGNKDAGAHLPEVERESTTASSMLLQRGVSMLRGLFRNPMVFKVGTDFQHDLDILRGSFAGVNCFDELQHYIDMTALDSLYHEVLVGQASNEKVSTQHRPAKAAAAPPKASVGTDQSTPHCSEKTVRASEDSNKRSGDVVPQTLEHDRSCYKEKSFQGEPYLKKIAKRIKRQQKKKKRKSLFSGGGGGKAAPRPRGLSAIVREILGKPLDKHEQVSMLLLLCTTAAPQLQVVRFCKVIIHLLRGCGRC